MSVVPASIELPAVTVASRRQTASLRPIPLSIHWGSIGVGDAFHSGTGLLTTQQRQISGNGMASAFTEGVISSSYRRTTAGSNISDRESRVTVVAHRAEFSFGLSGVARPVFDFVARRPRRHDKIASHVKPGRPVDRFQSAVLSRVIL